MCLMMLVLKKIEFEEAIKKGNMLEHAKFVNNYYASVEYTEKHLAELRDKWNLSDDSLVKNLFDLYREFGYDNFKDSDSLEYMSKIINDGKREGVDDPTEYLRNVLMSIEDEFAGEGKTESDYINSLRSQARILK